MLRWFPEVSIYALGQKEFKSHWHKVSCRPQSTVLLDDYFWALLSAVSGSTSSTAWEFEGQPQSAQKSMTLGSFASQTLYQISNPGQPVQLKQAPLTTCIMPFKYILHIFYNCRQYFFPLGVVNDSWKSKCPVCLEQFLRKFFTGLNYLQGSASCCKLMASGPASKSFMQSTCESRSCSSRSSC